MKENNNNPNKEKEILQDLEKDFEKEKEIQADIKKDFEELKKLENEERENGFEIIVNGEKISWPKREITYDEVVNLAYPNRSKDPNIYYQIEYKYCHSNTGGTLEVGQSVKVKEGMVFNATPTNRS